MYKKVLALVLATVLLGGCDRGGESLESGNSPTLPVSSDSPQNSDGISEDSVKTGGIPEDIANYVKNLDNGDFVFVDYEFNSDPEIVTDASLLGDVYDKALDVLKATEEYKSFAEKFPSAELFGRFTESPEDYLDENGAPVPIFKRAFTDDFDCDGTAESFIMTAIPMINNESGEERWFEREYLIFVGENGAVLIDDYYNADIRAVLDYGCCKQIIVASEGWAGVDSKSNIWGVRSGKAVELYGGRLSYKKADCFLYADGAQGIGDLAVYDIDKGEYLAIQGKTLNTEEVLAMDTTGALEEYRERLENGWSVTLLGGKFYMIGDGNFEGAQFVYENDKFISSNELVRLSCTPGITGEALNTLADVDYDAALASMIAPENIGNTTSNSLEEMSYQLYDEIFLDQHLLKSMEQDRLYVMVNLHIDEEALRAEYEERYPELAEDYYSWGRFLSSSGDQVIEEFVRDYDIDYEDLGSVFKMGASFYYELDKDTISSMLNDTRVAEIIYSVGGYPVIVDC